jgi:hypothetical protein
MKKNLILTIMIISLIGCKKEEIEYETASFSIECSTCSISYDNAGDKATETVISSFKKELKYPSNASITVVAKGITTFRFLLAYREVHTKIVNGTQTFHYNYKSNILHDGTTTHSFGTPDKKPNNQTSSSKCGARTKDGGSCQRLVKGGGRCWQH